MTAAPFRVLARRWKWFVIAAGIIGITAGLSAYVAVPAVGDLAAARRALATASQDDERRLQRARARTARAHARLNGRMAKVLGPVPLVGHNIRALDAMAEGSTAILDEAIVLADVVGQFEEHDLLDDGHIDVDRIAALTDPLREQARALGHFERDLIAHRTGWLVPPLWDEVDAALHETRRVHERIAAAAALVAETGALLGREQPRTYLVLLLNNNELRGAGGLLSGVGTLTVRDGRLLLGRFSSVHALRTDPELRVPAPEDFQRRFSRYRADATLWLNTSFSPDVPDVALVASRLYRRVTGTPTDGAIVVDPRGLAALLPAEEEVEVPRIERTLDASELPRFTYSDSYEAFRSPRLRRQALVATGREVFDVVVDRGISFAAARAGLADAVSGGHLRFVSFDPREARILARAGVAGELHPPPEDPVFVAANNFGTGRPGVGTKLDYWVDRTIAHRCEVADPGSLACVTEVTLDNRTPKGLSRYVAGKPYGLLRELVDIYIPAAAEVTSVSVDGEIVPVTDESQDGYRVIGLFTAVPRATSSTVALGYRVPITGRSFAVRATPQPLARDARLEIALDLPEGWIFRGPGTMPNGVLRWSGTLDREVTITATRGRRSGLPALWRALVDFWNEPLFG